MAIIRIPTPLRKFTGGKEEVTVTGANIRACFADLEVRHPGLVAQIYDAQGDVKKFINIFANSEDIRYLKNLDTEVGERDEISIVPAIAGGCL